MKKRIQVSKTFAKTLAIGFLSLLVLACKDDAPNKRTSGVLKDFSNSMSGCGWLIQLPDSTYLEPTNLRELDFELIDNKFITIEYHIMEGGTVCQMGEIVEIDEIR